MPLDLDQLAEKQDRKIVVRGETFTVPRHRPELMDEIDKLEATYIETKDATYSDVMIFAEGRLRLLLDDGNGQLEKWDALRARETEPIEYGEIILMSKQAYELVTGVPTVPSGPSGTGLEKAAPPSTVGSS